jgi:hypothetical protein
MQCGGGGHVRAMVAVQLLSHGIAQIYMKKKDASYQTIRDGVKSSVIRRRFLQHVIKRRKR